MFEDNISSDALRKALRGTMFAENIHLFDEIGSTNSAAMEAAQAGADEGSVFLAERQTNGRGRGGNSWHSEVGAIYMSVVLRPTLPANDILVLSLATGLAVSLAVEHVCGVVPDLRWPNDIMLAEKKLGGILCEMNADAIRVRHAVVGIGLNVNQGEFPDEIGGLATSLFVETGKKWPRLQLIAALLQALEAEYSPLQRSPAEVIKTCIARFEKRSSYARGKRVKVADEYEGVTDGLDERGFLRVQTATGPRLVISGGVRPA
jgi:BirA family transcriptional regulator, biotin operon repressor / biotin---[acetyl-CoA-carboxylase] ligase